VELIEHLKTKLAQG